MSQEELLIGLLAPSGWFLWWAGGRGLYPFRKGYRRFIWPLICAWASLWTGHSFSQAVVGFAGMGVAHHLGYGSENPLVKRSIATLAIGACVLGFGVSWPWAVWVSVWFGVTYWVSRVHNPFGWAIVESSTGLFQGLAIALGLTR